MCYICHRDFIPAILVSIVAISISMVAIERGDIADMEVEYRIKHLADDLNISSSAARKYYAMVEEQRSKKFERNRHGYVIFNQQDVALFRKMLEYRDEYEFKLQDAIKYAISAIDGEEASEEVVSNNDNPMDSLKFLSKEVHRLNNLLESQQEEASRREDMLLKIVQQQQESISRIENKLDEREETKQIAESSEDETEEAFEDQEELSLEDDDTQKEVPEKKKSFWVKLFGG